MSPVKARMHSVNSWMRAAGKYAVGLPLLLSLIVLLAPLVTIVVIARFVRRRWFSFRLRRSWPCEKFVLFAYTRSEHWAPYIETQILPGLGKAVLSIDRSQEAWKRAYPLEAATLKAWAGDAADNPIALVIHNPVRVSVFRFYDAFLQNKHGKPQDLESLVQALLETVEGVSERTT